MQEKSLCVAFGASALLGISFLPGDGKDEISQAELERLTKEIRVEISELREKEFPRPVAVAIADEAEFREYVQQRMEKMTTPEEIAAEELVAKLLGLIPAEMDYVETMMELLEDQVGGYYDPDTEGFYLMSRFGGDIAKVILAHELTHALDDQLYDIDGTLEKLEGNGDAGFAYQAVVEGSGTAVMNIWTIGHMAELDPRELMEAGSMGAEALEEAEPFLWKPLVAVYAKGSAFLNRTDNVLAGSMQMPSLDDFHRAFTDPPRSSEQILHPEKYWDEAERDDPIDVAFEPGTLPDGWEVLDEDTLGELGLGLFVQPPKKRKGMKGQLALLGTKYTYDASEGWGGDRLILLGAGEARVLVWQTVWDSQAEADEFAAALDDLAEHLDGAVTDTAGVHGMEEFGRRVVTGETGAEVLLVVRIGVGTEQAASVLDALEIRVTRPDETPDRR